MNSSKKYIIHPVPKPATSLNNFDSENLNDKSCNKTLKLILNDKILPCLFSDIRMKALKDIEKKNKNRFKISQTSPQEFNFNLLIREKLNKCKEADQIFKQKANSLGQKINQIQNTNKMNNEEASVFEDNFDLYQAEIFPNLP